MPMPAPKKPRITEHPGSSKQEILDEPEWRGQHAHRVGFRNNTNRVAGLTHDGDHDPEDEEERRFVEEAMSKYRELRRRRESGKLVNFQDIMNAQTDFHEHRPDAYPVGWRFVVRATEDGVKYEQDWPANVKKREQEEQKRKEEEKKEKGNDANQNYDQDNENDEHDWRRSTGQEEAKHHGAYGKGIEKDPGEQQNCEKPIRQTEYRKLREKYSPEEIALLRHLQHETEYMKQLESNDGKHVSPMKHRAEQQNNAIDTVDGQTPDNWIPRSGNLVRRTGQHPLNAEPRLDKLFEAGLITPNELHYVRNHGAVPRLYWDTHVLDVCDGALRLSMDDLKQDFEPVNLPVALACDGNRRGELNMIKKSKGFDWGPGAISCAYWKGALLHEVLAAAGVRRKDWNKGRKWVNFEGADNPSEGKYQTCIPLAYALDPGNDVLLAYEMNNVKLPPDHGFPVRLLIPGFVGGRCVKWLARIWISDRENDSHFHIWDNRVLPAFISEKDGEFAKTMFNHPSTACNEQNLNSVIVKPAQNEKLDIVELLKQDTYRVQGYAYDGGGHEVQRVELSLDGGKTWLYCIRKFPDRPIRNGRKFWTWLHWQIDVDAAHLVRAESLTVRCFNVFKNTQPEKPVWNTMGMMNNGHYIVKPTTDENGRLVFQHPFNQEDDEGWMKPSTENQLNAAKQSSGVPDKQFTREEIEKHGKKDDCWMVVNERVYDVTSVVSWHPGGSAAIVANSGILSLDVTTSFESIHDDYAHKKLSECVIGKVTDKAAKFMREAAKEEAEKAAKESGSEQVLQSKKWVPVTLKKRKQLSEDTYAYIFAYDNHDSKRKLGLGTCQHIQFGIHMEDKMLIRSYTPTKPIIPEDDDGTFELVVKTYLPDENQPGGAFSNFLSTMPLGEKVEVNGPTGEIEYFGNGEFEIEGQKKTYKKISLVVGGSGLTPAYSLLQAIVEKGDKDLEVRVIDANKTEDDILLREDLDRVEKQTNGQVKITHVLSHPKDPKNWKGLSGHVNAEIIKESLFEPADDSVVFLCGPPGMIQKAAMPALKDWGYQEDENIYGF